MLENKFYAPKVGSDGNFYLRVVQSTKGLLGQKIEKTGFLKFETEEEATTAHDTLESGSVGIKLGAKASNSDLYEIIPVAVSAATPAAQPAIEHAM